MLFVPLILIVALAITAVLLDIIAHAVYAPPAAPAPAPAPAPLATTASLLDGLRATRAANPVLTREEFEANRVAPARRLVDPDDVERSMLSLMAYLDALPLRGTRDAARDNVADMQTEARSRWP